LEEAALERLNGLCGEQVARRHDSVCRRTALANVFSNSLEPGWVATKMGGAGAPDDLDQAHLTQVWLAAGEDRKADVTGQYFFHLKPKEPNPQSHDTALQDRLILTCTEISGVPFPA
jgi:hypothetical protein